MPRSVSSRTRDGQCRLRDMLFRSGGSRLAVPVAVRCSVEHVSLTLSLTSELSITQCPQGTRHVVTLGPLLCAAHVCALRYVYVCVCG